MLNCLMIRRFGVPLIDGGTVRFAIPRRLRCCCLYTSFRWLTVGIGDFVISVGIMSLPPPSQSLHLQTSIIFIVMINATSITVHSFFTIILPTPPLSATTVTTSPPQTIITSITTANTHNINSITDITFAIRYVCQPWLASLAAWT